jgi:hypothetical protein
MAAAYLNGEPVKGSVSTDEQSCIDKIMMKIEGRSDAELLAYVKNSINRKP